VVEVEVVAAPVVSADRTATSGFGNEQGADPAVPPGDRFADASLASVHVPSTWRRIPVKLDEPVPLALLQDSSAWISSSHTNTCSHTQRT